MLNNGDAAGVTDIGRRWGKYYEHSHSENRMHSDVDQVVATFYHKLTKIDDVGRVGVFTVFDQFLYRINLTNEG